MLLRLAPGVEIGRDAGHHDDDGGQGEAEGRPHDVRRRGESEDDEIGQDDEAAGDDQGINFFDGDFELISNQFFRNSRGFLFFTLINFCKIAYGN